MYPNDYPGLLMFPTAGDVDEPPPTDGGNDNRVRLQWGDLVLRGRHARDLHVIEDIAGWDDLPDEQRGTLPARPNHHGAFGKPVLLGERYVTVEGHSYSPDARDQLLAALRAGTTPSDVGDLTITMGSETLTARARLKRRKATMRTWKFGMFGWALQWVCADPFRYGVTEYADTGLPTDVGGLRFPLFTNGAGPVVQYAWTGTPDASPSTETIGGVLTRTNLALRPVPTGTGGWATGSTSITTASHAPGAGPEGRDAALSTRVDSTVSRDVIGILLWLGSSGASAALSPMVEPGKVYTFSLSIKAERALAHWQGRLAYVFIDSGGAVIGSYDMGPLIPASTMPAPDADGYVRFSQTTVAAPANAAYMRTLVYCYQYMAGGGAQAANGEQCWFADAQLEEVPNPTGTFYDWTGTPNASESTETIDGVVTRTNFAINPGPALPATGGAPVVGWVGLTRQGSAAAAESNSVYTVNIAADSGEQWAASVVLTALNTPTTVRVDLRETASGAFGAQPYIATVMSVNLVPGVPQTVTLGGIVSTSPSTDGLRLAFSGSGVSTNVAVGNTLITRGTTPGAYFYGDTSDIPDQVEPTPFFYGGTADGDKSPATGWLDFGERGEAGRMLLTNHGDATAWPRFRLEGPAPQGVTITHVESGDAVTTVTYVPAQASLTLDYATGSARLDGVERSGQITRRGWRGVQPGEAATFAISAPAAAALRVYGSLRSTSW